MNTVKINAKQAKMIAHRGVSGLERENTCPAFVAAGNRSYFGIETDIHVTKDGKFVVIHDETVTRVSNGRYSMNVEEVEASLLNEVTLPDKDGSIHRQDIRIPMLKDYISICKKYEKIAVLEIKNHFQEEDLKRLVTEIEADGYLDSMIFISFDLENCVNLRKLLPNAKIQFLTEKEVTDAMISMLKENRLDLDLYYPQVNQKVVEQLHAKGIEINCWTCDDKETAEAIVDMGVDYITSNILE